MLEEIKKEKETQNKIQMDLDKAFKKIKEMTAENNTIATPAIDAVMNIMKENLDAKSDFSILHGFIALSKCIVFLAQALCDSEEHFENELGQSYKLAINKIIPAIKSQNYFDGSEVEFDQEDFSLRRIMMALAQSMDTVFWDLLVANYSEIRQSIEEEETEEAKKAEV